MSTAKQPCAPLPYESVFLKLLADMDGENHRLGHGASWEKLVRYQTLIAAAGPGAFAPLLV